MQKNITIYESDEQASINVANHIASIINNNLKLGKRTVLGLATGNTPIKVYKHLVHLHKTENLSFKNVVTFNLDEYFPMSSAHPLSYVHFMKTHLFNHIDILPEDINIPDGSLSENQVDDFCRSYEQKIDLLGGLDFQLLGVGRTGHIGFNEPGSSADSITRLVALNTLTREDAISDFNGLENVPTQAISMGVRTIFKAKEIMLLAFSERKAKIIEKVIFDSISSETPGSYLQNHMNVNYILDQKAAEFLSDKISKF